MNRKEIVANRKRVDRVMRDPKQAQCRGIGIKTASKIINGLAVDVVVERCASRIMVDETHSLDWSQAMKALGLPDHTALIDGIVNRNDGTNGHDPHSLPEIADHLQGLYKECGTP